MGYRVDNLTKADARINERLSVIAARGGNVKEYKDLFMSGDVAAIQRMVEVIERYGAQIKAEEYANGD